jgi:hypothetical protein
VVVHLAEVEAVPEASGQITRVLTKAVLD